MGENSYQKSFHIEVDSIGQVNVPSDKYWGGSNSTRVTVDSINMLRYFY
jgi:hypothetical protein